MDVSNLSVPELYKWEFFPMKRDCKGPNNQHNLVVQWIDFKDRTCTKYFSYRDHDWEEANRLAKEFVEKGKPGYVLP